MSQNKNCQIHQKEILDLFCEECQVDICDRCNRTGKHRMHKAIDLHIIMDTKLKQLEQIQKNLKQKNEDILSQENNVQQLLQRLNKFEQDAMEEIQDSTKKLQSCLDQQVQEKTGNLQQSCQKLKQQLNLHSILCKGQLEKIKNLQCQVPQNLQEIDQQMKQTEQLLNAKYKRAPQDLDLQIDSNIDEIQDQLTQLFSAHINTKEKDAQQFTIKSQERNIKKYYFKQPYFSKSLLVIKPGNFFFMIRLSIFMILIMTSHLNFFTSLIELFALYCTYFCLGNETKLIIFIQQLVFQLSLVFIQIYSIQQSSDLFQSNFPTSLASFYLMYQLLFFIIYILYYLDNFLSLKGNTQTFKRFRQATDTNVEYKTLTNQCLTFSVNKACYLHGITHYLPISNLQNEDVNSLYIKSLSLFGQESFIFTDYLKITCFSNVQTNRETYDETADFFFSKIVKLQPNIQYTLVVQLSGKSRQGQQVRKKVETTEGDFCVKFEKTYKSVANIYSDVKDECTIGGIILRVLP